MDTEVRRELAALRAEVAALRRRVERKRRHQASRWLGVALMVCLALLPAALGASDRFADVPDGAYYHDDASLLADNGITFGCGGDNYCPDQAVNRGQMAAFLSRLGGFGDHDPVVNAKTAQTAQTAASADSLGGYAPSDFVRFKDHAIQLHYSPLHVWRAESDPVQYGILFGGAVTAHFPDGQEGTYDLYFPLDHPSYLLGEWLRPTQARVCYENIGGANIKRFALESTNLPAELGAAGQAGTGPERQCSEFNIFGVSSADAPLVLHLRVDVADPSGPGPVVNVYAIRLSWAFNQTP